MKRFFVALIVFTIAGFVLWGCSTAAVKQTSAGEQPTVQAQAAAKSGESPDQAKKAGMSAPEKSMAEQESKKEAVEGGMQFSDVHFDFDKYNLKSGERVSLNKIADWLNKNQNYMVRIEGNCDERGTAEYNLALGNRRANAAMNYLVTLGIKKARIKAISYGKEKPLDPGHNEEAWAKNRRDHFVVMNKM
ncbi:MAG: peptidoglycan-associated lipoprotein Pal [Syntrophales bacterium]|jgi:peptidoglycan-associated lipoprotein